MRQGINLDFVLKKRNAPDRSLGEAVALCRDAGFSIVDYLTPVVEEDWREQAEAARELMDSCGVEVHQAHCPFFRYKEGGLKLFAEYAPRAVRAASILGAEFFVIHADEYREPDSFDFERILRKTREYLARICVRRRESARRSKICLRMASKRRPGGVPVSPRKQRK